MTDYENRPVVIHSPPAASRTVRTFLPDRESQESADIQLAVLNDAEPVDVSSTAKHSYPNAEDIILKMVKGDSVTKCHWLWVRHIRWWYRIAILGVFSGYWLMIMDNLVTRRHIQTTRFYLGPPEQNHRIALPDLLFGLGEIDSASAKNFVSATPALAVIGMVVILAVRRKYAIWAEVVWIEFINLFLIGIVQVMTGYPDPYPPETVCGQIQYSSYGSWVWSRVSTTFCGDMMWSGHTYHTLLSFIMIYRHFYPSLVARLNLCLYTFIFWTIFGLWFIAFEICLLGSRLHYTSDVLVAIIITLFLCTNRAVLAPGVAFLYPVVRAEEIYIHLLPENYKRKCPPEKERPYGLGQYI